MSDTRDNDVIVVGSCVQDLISYTPRFPRPGESVRGHSYKSGFGGKGANQAVCAAKLGARVAMVGKVGTDIFGPATVENFKSRGVNTDYMQLTDKASTATANIMVDTSGENMIVVVLGANELLTVEDVRSAESLIAKSKAEILTGLKLDDQSDESIHAIMNYFKSRGAVDVIITLGGKGSVLMENGQLVRVPAQKVDAVDTVGAGDCFIGSLAYFCSRNPALPLVDKIDRAGRIAALSVQKPGTQSSYPSKAEVDGALLL